MQLMNVSAETLSRDLCKEIPPMYVVIAKHDVLSMDSESIAEVLGVSALEVEEVKLDSLYKEVRVYVGAVHAQQRIDQTAGWDAIEGLAIEKLVERLPFEKDSEFLLRVAAVANKASRREAKPGGVLDPSRVNGRTAITLTQRLVTRLTNAGRETVEERELSIHDGSMAHPSFGEIDELLSVSKVSAIPRRVDISTHTSDVDLAELDSIMRDKGY